jgi:hypothetical protein
VERTQQIATFFQRLQNRLYEHRGSQTASYDTLFPKLQGYFGKNKANRRIWYQGEVGRVWCGGMGVGKQRVGGKARLREKDSVSWSPMKGIGLAIPLPFLLFFDYFFYFPIF